MWPKDLRNGAQHQRKANLNHNDICQYLTSGMIQIKKTENTNC